MNAGIITCSTLTKYVMAAQEKMGTKYPIIELDNRKHDRSAGRLHEKLVSGKWDEQFRIYQPGEAMQECDFE